VLVCQFVGPEENLTKDVIVSSSQKNQKRMNSRRRRNPPSIVFCVGFLFLPWLLIDPHGSCGTGTVC
jgi:hypothetical protein